jgi:hypothetical protein
MKMELKIGNASISVEARDLKDLFKEAAALTQMQQCICGSKNIALNLRVTKGKEDNPETKGKKFSYYEAICLDCSAKAQLGEYDGGLGYFLKKWEKWDKKGVQTNKQTISQEQFEDELAF